jgi:hypothetical protein
VPLTPRRLLTADELARVKENARRRRWYVMSSSSSSLSAVTASSSAPSSEKMVSDSVTVMDLLPGHMMEFGTLRIYSGHVHEMQRLGYFRDGVGRAPGAKEVPEPEGELVVFEEFFTTGLRLPAFRGPTSPAYTQCHGGIGEVYVGSGYIWRRAFDLSLR